MSVKLHRGNSNLEKCLDEICTTENIFRRLFFFSSRKIKCVVVAP